MYSGDGFHPNDQGYAYLAEVLLQAITSGIRARPCRQLRIHDDGRMSGAVVIRAATRGRRRGHRRGVHARVTRGVRRSRHGRLPRSRDRPFLRRRPDTSRGRAVAGLVRVRRRAGWRGSRGRGGHRAERPASGGMRAVRAVRRSRRATPRHRPAAGRAGGRRVRAARAQRLDVAVLPGNLAAIRFYEACGFTFAGERADLRPARAAGRAGGGARLQAPSDEFQNFKFQNCSRRNTFEAPSGDEILQLLQF